LTISEQAPLNWVTFMAKNSITEQT